MGVQYIESTLEGLRFPCEGDNHTLSMDIKSQKETIKRKFIKMNKYRFIFANTEKRSKKKKKEDDLQSSITATRSPK